MLKYTMKRILLMLVVLLVITAISFFLIKLLPVNDTAAFGKDAEAIEARREALGYNKPLPEQFMIFLGRTLIGGDWGLGEMYLRGQDVYQVFLEKLPATMIVNLYSILFSIPVGIALGIYAALKKNKWQDYLISTVVMIMVSVPSFVYGFLVQHFMYFKWGIFKSPVMKPGYDYFSWAMFKSIIMPILALAFGTIAGFTRVTRAELTEVLTSEYMLLARTKGLTKVQATVRHAFRNCMIIVVPSILGSFISIMSGSMIIESIFGIPGVGGLMLNSIRSLDYNFFMLLTVFYTLIGLLAGLIIDLSYGMIDPRIRMGAKK